MKQYYNLDIPSYSLPYIVNGDNSGITEEDKETIDRYLEQYKGNVTVDCYDKSESFCAFPEFGLACTCSKCTITVS